MAIKENMELARSKSVDQFISLNWKAIIRIISAEVKVKIVKGKLTQKNTLIYPKIVVSAS
jgi:hypothetical protein